MKNLMTRNLIIFLSLSLGISMAIVLAGAEESSPVPDPFYDSVIPN